MVVPVNFSVSSQGNAIWVVILATTNTRRRLRKILFAVEEERKIFAKINLGSTCLTSQ